MHSNERFDAILDHVKRQKRATVAELSKLLYVSEATVRRDLSEMQHLGLLKRTHGGVIWADTSEEVSIFIRRETNAREKEETAFIALSRLPDFQTLFVDNSSTCLALAERMNLRHKTVVTNGLRVASKLLQKEGARILMPGGELKENTGFSDSMACNTLRSFRFDLALLSCAALDPQGCYENTLSVRELKATVMAVSTCPVLLADHSKLGSRAAFLTAALRDYACVFTNADDERIAPYQAAGIHIFNRLAEK